MAVLKERNHIIDAGKGLGILLVVLGHSLQRNIDSYDANIFFRIIYSFHMPLFMFLSGCVAKYGSPQSVTKNIKRLVLPFFAWYIIAVVVIGIEERQIPDFVQSIIQLIKSPDYGLWFLWVLFLCHICFYVLSRVQKLAGVAGAVLAFLLIQIIPVNILGIGLLKIYFVYFVAGYIAIRYKHVYTKRRVYYMLLSVIIFIMCFPYWQRVDVGRLSQLLSHFPSGVITHIQYVSKLFRYLVGFAGIGMILSLIYLIRNVKYLIMCLTKIGLYTLEIYVSHQLMLTKGITGNSTINVLICFIIALSGSLLLAFILKKVPYVKTILYGEPSRKKEVIVVATY